jgi:hypothetical protein
MNNHTKFLIALLFPVLIFVLVLTYLLGWIVPLILIPCLAWATVVSHYHAKSLNDK